ncbi:MAG: tRNA lysidine(34) synthetase TilS [Clostridia bacterium]
MLEKLKLLNNQPVVLAVSGGIDSMVMLDIFIKHYKGDFCVATVNHNIRQTAKQDCLFVADFCKRYSVECNILCVDVPSHQQKNHLSQETSARLLRHDVLEKFADGKIICLAHNKNDNAETILMHLLRGSGAKGALGIIDTPRLFRPLIDCSRQQIEQYAKENSVSYVIDHTNDDITYTRNFVRKVILPDCKKVNANYLDNIINFSKLISADQVYLIRQANELLNIYSVEVDNKTAIIPLQLFECPLPLVSRAIFIIFSKLGVNVDIEQVHIKDICSLSDKIVGKSLNLPFDFIAYRDYNSINISSVGLSSNAQEVIQSCPFSVGDTTIANRVVTVSKVVSGNKIDLNKVPPTAVFRTRRQGDKFAKFGGGTVSLSDYLTDIKIPLKDRDKLVVLANGQDILAIVGVEISRTIKVDDDSNVYYINYK